MNATKRAYELGRRSGNLLIWAQCKCVNIQVVYRKMASTRRSYHMLCDQYERNSGTRKAVIRAFDKGFQDGQNEIGKRLPGREVRLAA